jgi:TonB family protein
MELAQLTVLNQRYTIKRMLGDPGPFDITYLGQDVDSEEEYVIREFFPTHLVQRASEKTSVEIKGGDEEAELFDSGLEYFQKESQVLAELSHEALPSSYDLFEANGTFYRVRPHPPSMSLRKGLEDKGQLSEKAALTIMMPVLEALREAHESGLYHGGVSPRSIRLLEDGKVLLTGFRGAFFQLARETGHLSDLVQSGTSAVEQYTPRGQQGPWTDVYAAAATICQMVTGEVLPDSTDRLEGEDALEERVQDADVFSAPGVREALVDALSVDPSQRLQSIEALIEALTESSTRYEGTEDAYSIMPVEPEARDQDGGTVEGEEVEVLSTRAENRPARASGGGGTDDFTVNPAVLIGIPILLLALGGGAWFMMSGGSSGAASGTYRDMRERADPLFEAQEYERAELLYNQALSIQGDDQYVQKRLAELERIQREGSQEQYQEFLKRGNELKARADSLYEEEALGEASSSYSEALASFYSARDANPNGEEAQQQIDVIEARQERIAKRQAGGEMGEGAGGTTVDEIAEFFREQGNRQLEAGNLQAALDKYRQAREYAPDNEELQQAIADLQNQIEQQQRRQEFQQYYNEGQELLRAGNYRDAKASFQKAQEIYPNNPDLQDALAEADRLLKEKEVETKKYERFRQEGDSLYDQDAFQEAIAAYKKALDIRPDDEYVKNRIEEANRELEQMRLAQQEVEEQEEKRKDIVDEDGVYTVVDQEPKVEGGLASLTEAASYPDEAREQGVQGRVYVKATVNADGTVRQAEVLRGPGAGTHEEARRIVDNAEFIPAKYNGEAVPARKTVWIQFRLDN